MSYYEEDMYGGRKASKWNEFVRANKGQGLTMTDLSVKYRQSNKVIPRPKPSACVKKQEAPCRSNINPKCSWSIPKKLTKSGVPRIPHCRKSNGSSNSSSNSSNNKSIYKPQSPPLPSLLPSLSRQSSLLPPLSRQSSPLPLSRQSSLLPSLSDELRCSEIKTANKCRREKCKWNEKTDMCVPRTN